MDPWLLLPRMLLFLDTLRPRDAVAVVAVVVVVVAVVVVVHFTHVHKLLW